MATLQPLRDLSSIAFTLLGLLTEGARHESDLHAEMQSLGWTRIKKGAKGSNIFKRLEAAGLILSATVLLAGGQKHKYIQLTSAGFEIWSQYLDFCCSVSERWAHIGKSKASCDFVALSSRPPVTNRPKKYQRGPTKAEQKAILESADREDFRHIYEFSLRCRTRIVDLQNAQIEKINWSGSILTLEDRAVSGRLIDVVTVKFSEGAGRILKEAVGDRSAGLIFLRQDGSGWHTEALYTVFRTSRTKAGVSSDVGLSGRGGKLGYAVESPDEEGGDE